MKSDGTAVAVGYMYDGSSCDVSDWRDIIAVSAGSNTTVGLKSDGTVDIVGFNISGVSDSEFDVSAWTDVVAISTGYNNIIGLKSDGTAISNGYTTNAQCDVSDWTDIRIPQ